MNIFEKSIAFTMEAGKIGVRRKVNSSMMEVKNTEDQPDPKAIAVNKEIISCKEFDAIGSLDSSIRLYLYRKALPAPFRRGTYLIPMSMVEQVDQVVDAYKQNRESLVTLFLSVYEKEVEEARQRLGTLYNSADYPPLDAVRGSFYVNTSYLQLGVPSTLNQLSPEIFQREQAAFKNKLASAAEEIQQALRTSFLELVEHMKDRLAPSEDGKQKTFRDSLVMNMREFLNDFTARNIADDAELEKLVNQARSVLNGTTPDKLRNSDSLREQIATNMEGIKNSLSTMITNAPRRKFNLD
jgi:hypothetical protein